MISIIVPTLNEADNLPATLQPFQDLRHTQVEIIVADGGSSDGTLDQAYTLADHVIAAPRGRARQMNAGAKQASGEVLLFLHADARLTADALVKLDMRATFQSLQWGRFNIKLDGDHWLYPVIAWLMNRRSRITGVATGDQAIFISRPLFDKVRGYPDLPLMEDIEISKRLKRHARPRCLNTTVTASTRYWRKNGLYRSIIRMWLLRFAWFAGVSPRRLAKIYYG